MVRDNHESTLTHRLITLAKNMPTRKTRWAISAGESSPSPIDEALKLVHKRFRIDTPFDTAILKYYIPADLERMLPAEKSEAFDWHKDPDEYHDEFGLGMKKIVLWSLTGFAEFYVKDGNADFGPLECVPNSALLLPAHMKHRVTPPDPARGTRILLFFGQRT